MPSLTYVPRAEFDRARNLNASPAARAALFATLARINTLSMIMAAGSGHIGSSFSSLDIVSWLYLNEMKLPATPDREQARDVFFSSKGHDVPGLYAVMIALGQLPEDLLWKLRRLDGLPGHPDIHTPYIEANTGSLGMGISKAKGMAKANRLKGRSQRLFVMTGDGELQEGQIWESLGSAARLGLGEITVVVDHNKVQSDTLVSATADLGDLEARFGAFGWNVLRCDGHDMAALAERLAAARAEKKRPSVIIADTIKGRGVSFMEHTAMQGRWYKFHSGAPSEGDYKRGIDELLDTARKQCGAMGAAEPNVLTEERPGAAAPQGKPPQRLVRAYSAALLAEAEREPKLVALDADLVLDTGLIPFSEKYPDRFIECGISEMDMVSQASGLALLGFLPAVHSFACFLTPRANEQMYNADTECTRVIYTGSLAGLVPAGPGHSHQSVRDIALMGSLPNTTPVEPCCEAEVAMAVQWAVRDNSASTYLRLVSIPVDVPFDLPKDYRFKFGRGVALTEGNDVAVIGYGPVLLSEAFNAARLATQQGKHLRVINLPWLTRFDDDWLISAIAGCGAVLCLDNHLISGGQGERIAARLAVLGQHVPIKLLGPTGIPACGRNDEVLRHYGLDSQSIAKAAVALLRS